MTHGMDPGQMTPAERLDEVGALLALAMLRLWLKRRAGSGHQRVFREIVRRVARIALSFPPR